MATEQHLRQQLAAAYRLAALFGWEDTLYTHFSVRLPGDGEPRFLINPFGMMFDEVTASNRRALPSTARCIWPGKTPTA